MKRIISLLVLTTILLCSTVNVFAISYGEEHEGYSESRDLIYTDVKRSHWAYEETKRCKEKGWFQGYPDGRFMPDASITRAEAIKVIVSFLGRKLNDVNISNYHDVDVNDWFAPYIHAGEDLFPLKWKNNSAFQPNMPMTREDTVYALVVALGYDSKLKFADESILNMFSDKNSISSIMRPYFAVAIENELVSGFEDSTIRAQDALTRAQFAALLYRASTVGTLTKPDAKLQTIEIAPSSKQSLTVGDSFTFSATASYSDDSKESYSEINPYDSDYSGIVNINGNTVTAVKEGTCIIKFNNDYLKSAYVTVTVSNPTNAPKIKVTDYPETTEAESVQISGTVTDETKTEIDLTCNGRDIALNGNSFTYTANLAVGKNAFEFVATNGYGNKSTKSVEITRAESKPTTVSMVNVVGKSEADAKSSLEKLGFKVEVNTVWDENMAQGTVVKQSIDAGNEVEIGKTVAITVSGGKNDWVGWIDSLPSYVNSSNYIIEEKTQYRYKTKETTTSTSPSKSGWTLYDQSESWGSWSGWSKNSVTASTTREVNTKNVADEKQYKTQWHYTRYYGWNPGGYYVSWPWQGTYSKTYQESGWRDSPLENRGRADNVDATCYKDPSDSISVWWWNETTRTVELPATYHTEYQYRDKTVTYYFSRWSDWSSWSDTSVTSNSNKEVETKKVYRYKFK